MTSKPAATPNQNKIPSRENAESKLRPGVLTNFTISASHPFHSVQHTCVALLPLLSSTFQLEADPSYPKDPRNNASTTYVRRPVNATVEISNIELIRASKIQTFGASSIQLVFDNFLEQPRIQRKNLQATGLSNR